MTMKRRSFQLAVLAAAMGLWAGCGGDDGPAPPVLSVDASGSSSIDAKALSAQLETYAVAPLSVAEAASLAYMREEEQLAHDVYAVSVTLYPQQSIFVNVADSEATHSAAIKTLLDRYGLPDPLQGLPEGTFKTPAFQALYDALVAQSSLGLIKALEVGVEIEELDIYDLEAQMAVVDNADILMVYENLLRASRNHLRAFLKVLKQQGGNYVPQHLSQAEFDDIVRKPIEAGP
jgi:hypothetical protein